MDLLDVIGCFLSAAGIGFAVGYRAGLWGKEQKFFCSKKFHGKTIRATLMQKLFGKVVGCPHARGNICSLDSTKCELLTKFKSSPTVS